MSVRMRHTSGHSANRRSHHKVTGPRLSLCKDCNTSHVRHHVCANCGNYRGRMVIDVKAQIAKREAKIKARTASLGTEAKGDSQVEEVQEEKADKPLNAASLSKKSEQKSGDFLASGK